MGQKTIPISLRLKKNENWNSKWTVAKKEYAALLHFDLEIRKYFENIYNYKNFKLIKLNIVKTSKNINIYIYVRQHSKIFYKLPYNKIVNFLNSYYKNNNIKLFIKNVPIKNIFPLKYDLRKIYRFIKKNNRMNKKVKKSIYNFSYGFYTKNIHIISNNIKQSLQRKKSHKRDIKNINNLLRLFYKMFPNIVGYRLQFKGRINGSKRKRKVINQEGKIPFNTLKANIHYDFKEFKTPSGICSIKLWVFFKKLKKQKKHLRFSKKKIEKKKYTLANKPFYLKHLPDNRPGAAERLKEHNKYPQFNGFLKAYEDNKLRQEQKDKRKNKYKSKYNTRSTQPVGINLFNINFKTPIKKQEIENNKQNNRNNQNTEKNTYKKKKYKGKKKPFQKK